MSAGYSAVFSMYVLLFSLLCAIAFFEVFVKWLIVKELSPLKFTPAEDSLWPESARSELNRCTQQLEQLGFVKVSDHTIPSNEDPKPISRLFMHSKERCFAEVSLPTNKSMFCSISSHLENGWSLGITNMSADVSLGATWYAFLRLPNRLGKSVEGEPIDTLFQKFIAWRTQISKGLGVGIIPDIEASYYFENEQAVRRRQKRSLLKKSILWSLFEMKRYSRNPKTEWLGAYKQKSKSAAKFS